MKSLIHLVGKNVVLASASSHQKQHQQGRGRGHHTRGRRGRFPRGRFHSRGRGGGSWNQGQGLSAGENLLCFKRALRCTAGNDKISVLSDSCALSVSDYFDATSEHGGGEDYGVLCDEPDVECSSHTTNNDYDLYYDEPDVEEELGIGLKAEDIEDLTDAVLSTGNDGAAAGIGNSQSVVALPTTLSSIGMISVFWDIENCAVPSGVAAYKIVQKVRQQFYSGHREADFIVACDIIRMKPVVVGELSEAQVTVIHVPGDQKNAADEKLRSVLRRFSDDHKLTNSRIVLISGDVDFAREIHEIRYRDLIHVVLIHNDQAKRALTDAANESIRYSEFVSDLRKAAPTVGTESKNLKKTAKAAEETTRSMEKKLAVTKLPAGCQKVNTQVLHGTAVAKKNTASAGAAGCLNEANKNNQLTNSEKGKLSEVGSQVRAKVGLLATQHKENELYWRSLLSKTSIPQDFVLEVDSAGSIVYLVYPSTNKAKKAVAVLNKLAASGSDMPICLGILSEKVAAEETAVPGPGATSFVKKVTAAIDAHQAKVEAIKKQAACLKGNDQKSKEERLALQKLVEAYEAQLREFNSTVYKLPSSPQEAESITVTEVARLRRSSAVYGMKSKLLDGLNKRQIVFLVTSPGSGASLEVPSYLQDLGCRVLSIQPNDFTAEQCAKCAGSINALGPSECWTVSGERPSPKSKVVFTTARHFVQEFLRCGTALAGFQAIVVDGLQEDSAYQRVTLAVLRKHFVSQGEISLGDPATPLQLGKPANQNFQERFGPIGNLIWNYQFAPANALKLIEEKLRNLKDSMKGSLALDSERQCIVITGHKQYCTEARRYLQSIVTDQVARLAKKDREVLLTPHDSAYSTQPVLAVIGIGGQVDELLSPTNFRTIVVGDVKIPLPEFRKRVNELGDIVQYWFLKKDSAFQITYKTAKEASAAYSALSKQDDELRVSVKGQALEYHEEQRNQRPAFHAQVSLPRRRCTGIAFAELPNQASFDQIAGLLPLCLKLDGAVVTCDRNKKVPCQLYISGLPPTISQVSVEKALQASLTPKLKSVRLIHEPAFETSQKQLQALEVAIEKAFEREPGVGRSKVSLRIPKSGDYMFKGWMSFEDAGMAQSACALLKDTLVPSNGDSATLPLTIQSLVEGVFFFPCTFFAAVQKRVEAELSRQEGVRPEDNLKCDAFPCGEVVRMSLRANNLNDFHKVVQLFNYLLTFEAAQVESSLSTELVASVVKAAVPGGSVYVYRKPGNTRLVGEKEVVNTASEMLKKCSRAQAEELVRQLGVRHVQAELATDTEDRCPVCLEPPGKGEDPVEGHRLELCGHWHCKSCLLLVLSSSPLPLACFEEDHGVPLLKWPPNGTNMNPIENIWGTLKKNLASQNLGGTTEDCL
ncbi:hypothetical protein V5799_024210 [Amblyomma americanum]|uniref:NYN domain-containing protein n=1 Tax=Amblyomma americanum TaxID=6943 RepID=A0AAQ4ED51_AMBAM